MTIDKSTIVLAAGLVVIGWALVTGTTAGLAAGAGLLGIPGVLGSKEKP